MQTILRVLVMIVGSVSPGCVFAAPAMLSCKIDLDFERCGIRLAEDDASSEQESSEEAAERLARALEEAGTLVRQSPSARNYGIRGLALMELGRPLQALDDFDAAVDLQPNWRLHLMRSICHRRLLDHESMRNDLSAALRLTPPEDAAVAIALAGGLLSKWGYHDLAGKCLNHACKLQPGVIELIYLRGHCSLAAGAYADALVDAQRVLEDEATAAHGFDLMCQVAIAARGRDQALKLLRVACTEYPNNSAIIYRLASSLVQAPLSESEIAELCFAAGRCVELTEQQDVDCLILFADLLQLAGKADAAIAVREKACELAVGPRKEVLRVAIERIRSRDGVVQARTADEEPASNATDAE